MIRPDIRRRLPSTALPKSPGNATGESPILNAAVALVGAMYGRTPDAWRVANIATPIAMPAQPVCGSPDDVRQALMMTTSMAARALLDHLPFGIVVADATGRVVFDTAAARRLFDVGHVFSVREGLIHGVTVQGDCTLPAALARACMPPSRGRPRVIPVSLSSSHADVTALVIPLCMGAGARLAAVLLPDHRRARATAGLLSQLFGLTGTESDVLLHMISGRSVAEAATQLQVQTRTAREAWRTVWLKLGTRNDSECLQLLRLALLLPRDGAEERSTVGQ
jgi:DNA-binding CsgD family transcriptional regulator